MEKFVYQTIDNSILHGIRVDKEELGTFTALVKNLLQENIDSFRFDFGKQLMLETLIYKLYENLKNNVLPKLLIHGEANVKVFCIDTI